VVSLVTLREELSIALRIVGVRWRSQMSYTASFWIQIVSNFIVNFAEVVALFAMFYRFDAMGGWTLGEVAFLHGVSMVAFSIADTLAAGLDAVPSQIRQGEFDRTLIRPLSSWLQSLVSEVSLRHLGQFAQGVIIFGVALSLTDIAWTPGKALLLPIMLLAAIALFVALFTVQAILSFWTVNSVEAVNAFTYGGSNLARFPLHVFERWLRLLFLWVIPVGFVSFYPALYILGKPDPLGLPLLLRLAGPLITAIFCVVVAWAWNQGIRHYRSTGS